MRTLLLVALLASVAIPHAIPPQAEQTRAPFLTFGGAGSDKFLDVTTLPEGGFAVVGFFSGVVAVSPDHEVLESRGELDGVILRYGGDGRLAWCVTLGAGENDMVSCVAALAGGEVIVSGSFHQTIDLDPGPNKAELVADSDRGSYFLACYDAQGGHLWSRRLPARIRDLATDGRSRIAVAGHADARRGEPRGYLAVFDAHGKLQWQRDLGHFAGSVALGPEGDTYVASNGRTFMLSRFDSKGAPAWRREWKGEGPRDTLVSLRGLVVTARESCISPLTSRERSTSIPARTRSRSPLPAGWTS